MNTVGRPVGRSVLSQQPKYDPPAEGQHSPLRPAPLQRGWFRQSASRVGIDEGTGVGMPVGPSVLSQQPRKAPSLRGQHSPSSAGFARQRAWLAQAAAAVGLAVGEAVGLTEGAAVGSAVGAVGAKLGGGVGSRVVGAQDGRALGSHDGAVGAAVGLYVGGGAHRRRRSCCCWRRRLPAAPAHRGSLAASPHFTLPLQNASGMHILPDGQSAATEHGMHAA